MVSSIVRSAVVLAAVLSALVALGGDAVSGQEHTSMPFSVGAVTFGGNGCTTADVSVKTMTTSDSGVFQLTVGFKRAFTAASQGQGRKRVTCNGVIPITIEADKAIGIRQTKIAGHVSVPESGKASAEVRSEYFMPGARGPTTQKRFNQPGHGPFVIDEGVDTIWSACGQSQVTFRINTALVASGDKAVISISTSDPDGMVYTISTRDCDPLTTMA